MNASANKITFPSLFFFFLYDFVVSSYEMLCTEEKKLARVKISFGWSEI